MRNTVVELFIPDSSGHTTSRPAVVLETHENPGGEPRLRLAAASGTGLDGAESLNATTYTEVAHRTDSTAGAYWDRYSDVKPRPDALSDLERAELAARGEGLGATDDTDANPDPAGA